jgi:aspartate/methionine/tyrosine aminotransferase
MYQDRRDVLCEGLNSIGWAVTPPKATMFVWAKIPEFYQAMDLILASAPTKVGLPTMKPTRQPGIL